MGEELGRFGSSRWFSIGHACRTLTEYMKRCGALQPRSDHSKRLERAGGTSRGFGWGCSFGLTTMPFDDSGTCHTFQFPMALRPLPT